MKSLGLCVVMIVVLVAGCGGPMVEVSQKFEQTRDFTSYKTYAWMDGASRSDISMGSRDIDLDKTIREAVEKQMAAKGFIKVTAEPDVLINITPVFERLTTRQISVCTIKKKSVGQIQRRSRMASSPWISSIVRGKRLYGGVLPGAR